MLRKICQKLVWILTLRMLRSKPLLRRILPLSNTAKPPNEIDEEYTRSVWNPYTYTYMEELGKIEVVCYSTEKNLPLFQTTCRVR